MKHNEHGPQIERNWHNYLKKQLVSIARLPDCQARPGPPCILASFFWSSTRSLAPGQVWVQQLSPQQMGVFENGGDPNIAIGIGKLMINSDKPSRTLVFFTQNCHKLAETKGMVSLCQSISCRWRSCWES